MCKSAVQNFYYDATVAVGGDALMLTRQGMNAHYVDGWGFRLCNSFSEVVCPDAVCAAAFLGAVVTKMSAE